jgi:hypothetical protein
MSICAIRKMDTFLIQMASAAAETVDVQSGTLG